MHWRRPRIKPDMECDLGPVIGPIAPMRPIPFRRTPLGPSWVERGTALMTAWVGVIAYTLLVGGFFLAVFLTPKKAVGQTCETGRFQGLSALARSLNVKPAQVTTPNLMIASDCDGKTYDVLAIMQAMVNEMKKGKR